MVIEGEYYKMEGYGYVEECFGYEFVACNVK